MQLKLDNYDLSGNVIILTGGTDGIGKEMARILSKFNAKRLILPVRNRKKGMNVLEYIKSSNGHADNVEIWDMDLADLQSVKNFANKFINEVGELHMLFNNAGIWTARQVIKTKDELEYQFQVNHLAPFLLTKMLLDTMERSVSAQLPGKIVFTSSEGHKIGEIQFDNLNLEKGSYKGDYSYKGNFISMVKAYGNTKLMNVLTCKELSRIIQNENIAVSSHHPGFIKTNLSNMNNPFVTLITDMFMNIFAHTTEQGAINMLYPILSPEHGKETGKYYNQGIEEKLKDVADDQELARKLWDISEQILKEHEMIA